MKNKDLDQFDPDWDLAKKHAKANKAGLTKQESPGSERNLCQCCGQKIQKQPIDLWTHTNQLDILGLGFPLFYQFLKYCIILLIINIGVYNAYSMFNAIQSNRDLCYPQPKVHLPHLSSDQPHLPALQKNHSLEINFTVPSNNLSIPHQKTVNQTVHHQQITNHSENKAVHGKDHKQSHSDDHKSGQKQHGDVNSHFRCYTFMTLIANIEQKENEIELVLRCVSFAINILLLLYIRNNITKTEGYFDERTTTLSDYSVVISGIYLNEKVRENIVTFFINEFKEKPLDVIQVILLPRTQEIEEIQHDKLKILNNLRSYYEKDKPEDQNFLNLNKELESAKQKIFEEAKKYFQLISKDKIACEYAIVIFETQEEKELAIKQFNKIDKAIIKQYFGGNPFISIKEAENEEEIVWENFSVSGKKRFCRIILGWSLSIFFLALIFLAFYFALIAKSHGFLQALNEKEKENHPGESVYISSKYNGFVALVFVLMFSIVLFDKLLLSSLFHKFTHLQLHSTRSNEEFSFGLKYALGLFFTTAVMTLVVQAWQLKNYYSHPYGVVEEETIMFAMNAVFIPLFWLINPFRIAKKIKKCCYKGKKHFTQSQANKILQQDTYFLGKRFAQIIETMWFVFLYSTLLPVGAMVSVVGLGFYYWVDKYNLLRRSKLEGNVSSAFVQTSLSLLDFILILKPAGSIIFDQQLRKKSYQISDIILICIAFVYILIPKNRIIIFFNKEYFKPEEKSYSEMMWKFKQGYTGKHPFYSLLDPDQVRACKTVKIKNQEEKGGHIETQK